MPESPVALSPIRPRETDPASVFGGFGGNPTQPNYQGNNPPATVTQPSGSIVDPLNQNSGTQTGGASQTGGAPQPAATGTGFLGEALPPQTPATQGAYEAAQAEAAKAAAGGWEAKPYEVTPDMLVASQIKDIIASGSPLMQQAETNAKLMMQRRGLLNSSMAVGAAQDAVIGQAMPIAQSDAATYAKAGFSTTDAINKQRSDFASSQNAANITNAQLSTATSQFNAGQVNASFQLAAQITAARNIAEMQNATQRWAAQLQATTSLTIADKQAASALAIANIQSNTALSVADKQAATASLVANLQSKTTLSATQMQVAGQQAVASIQANASMSIAQQQAASAQTVATINQQTQLGAQQLVNSGALANIAANGQVQTAVTQLTNDNRLLLQNSAGAAQIYQNLFSSFQNIATSNLNIDDKIAQQNSQLQLARDALNTLAAVTGTTPVTSNISVGGQPISYTPPTTGGSTYPSPISTGGTPTLSTAYVNQAYTQVFGYPGDAAGVNFWQQQGLSYNELVAALQAAKAQGATVGPPSPTSTTAPFTGSNTTTTASTDSGISPEQAFQYGFGG